jgi:hypothetical protein
VTESGAFNPVAPAQRPVCIRSLSVVTLGLVALEAAWGTWLATRGYPLVLLLVAWIGPLAATLTWLRARRRGMRWDDALLRAEAVALCLSPVVLMLFGLALVY